MDPSGAVDLDEQNPSPPPASPLPQPRTSHRSLFFNPAEDQEEESLLPPATGEDTGDGSASAVPWTSEPSAGPSEPDPDSWTASSAGEKPAQLLSKRQLKDTAEAAVRISTGMVHTVAAKTELQKQLELYKADDEDAKAIGHPLAEIAYRRGDVVGGKLSPDANNLLQSVMGIAGYFAKQINKIGVIRQIEAGQNAGEVQTFPTEGAA